MTLTGDQTVKPDVATTDTGTTGRRRSIFRIARRQPTAVIGTVVLCLLIFAAVFAPFLGTVDPAGLSPISRLRPPQASHWFGTDALGRDIYSRVLYGARVSLVVGLSVAILTTIVGALIGIVSGYVRWLDAIVMRFMDGLMSIPSILLAIALMALSRPSIQNVIIAITIAEIPRIARLVRGVVLSLREEVYIEAAIASGTRFQTILFRHILPNAMAPIIVQATYVCAHAILAEASLSFIGAGTPPTIPSWGNIMAEGRTLWQVAPHLILFPAIGLSLTVLAINMMGDGVRDWLDPRQSNRR